MARLYSDEDFSHPVVGELRQLGHDVLTAHEAGQANQGVTDSAVLAFDVARGRLRPGAGGIRPAGRRAGGRRRAKKPDQHGPIGPGQVARIVASVRAGRGLQEHPEPRRLPSCP